MTPYQSHKIRYHLKRHHHRAHKHQFLQKQHLSPYKIPEPRNPPSEGFVRTLLTQTTRRRPTRYSACEENKTTNTPDNHLNSCNSKEQTSGFMFNPYWNSNATDKKKDDNNYPANHNGRMLSRYVLQKKQYCPAREESFKKRAEIFQSPGRNLDGRVDLQSLMDYRRNRRELHQPVRQLTTLDHDVLTLRTSAENAGSYRKTT